MSWIIDLMVLAGFGLFAAGLWGLSPSICMVVCGVLLAGFGILSAWSSRTRG